MGIEEDVYKIMHGIPCEPNIEPCLWENEYGHKPCRENIETRCRQNEKANTRIEAREI